MLTLRVLAPTAGVALAALLPRSALTPFLLGMILSVILGMTWSALELIDQRDRLGG